MDPAPVVVQAQTKGHGAGQVVGGAAEKLIWTQMRAPEAGQDRSSALYLSTLRCWSPPRDGASGSWTFPRQFPPPGRLPYKSPAVQQCSLEPS